MYCITGFGRVRALLQFPTAAAAKGAESGEQARELMVGGEYGEYERLNAACESGKESEFERGRAREANGSI